jgi:uncharacterized protein (TIGR03435 family)
MRNGAVIFGILVASACYGQTSTVQFDVVSVKMHEPENGERRMQLLPDGIQLRNVALQDFIVEAYGLALSDQLAGLPSWANSERFDIEAKVSSSDVEAFRKLTLEQIRLMGHEILTNRFRFASHEETKVLSVYALVVAKDGSRLKPSTMSDQDRNARTGVIGIGHRGNTQLTATGVTMDRLARTLSQQGLGRVVLDKTDLTGRYDFQLNWAPENVAADINAVNTSGPSIFTALTEQLGLKLESQKGPVPVLVVDHIEEPSPN